MKSEVKVKELFRIFKQANTEWVFFRNLVAEMMIRKFWMVEQKHQDEFFSHKIKNHSKDILMKKMEHLEKEVQWEQKKYIREKEKNLLLQKELDFTKN